MEQEGKKKKIIIIIIEIVMVVYGVSGLGAKWRGLVPYSVQLPGNDRVQTY